MPVGEKDAADDDNELFLPQDEDNGDDFDQLAAFDSDVEMGEAENTEATINTKSVGRRNKKGIANKINGDPDTIEEQPSSGTELDDPVVREFPVYSSQVLGRNLHILQYPTRSALRPLVQAQGTGIIESRLKPKSGIIEVDIPMDTSKFYDEEKGDKWNKVDRQTFAGVLKTGQSRYMAGVFRDGELHVSPIESVAQLRPQFRYFDKHVNAEKEANRMMKTDPTKPREARAIQMSAKSSGEFAPKYSGALAARKLADEEEFHELQWHDRDSNESWDMADKFVTDNKDILTSKTTLSEYTDKLQI